MKSDNPIAIVSPSISVGFDWARNKLELREYNGSRRTVTDISGQVYFIITEFDHARGMEFHDVIGIPECDPMLLDFVKTRIK